MRIVADLRTFFKDETRDYEVFVRQLFKTLALQYPEHRFLFFYDKSTDIKTAFTSNEEIIIGVSKIKKAGIRRWWTDLRSSRVLKKYKADILINSDGTCNLITSVAQLMMLPNLAFSTSSSVSGIKPLFSKRMMMKYDAKASKIALFSEGLRQHITDHYRINPEKVVSIAIAAKPGFEAIEWKEKEKVKELYADGCEYFVFTGGFARSNNLLNLLKAFTLFKTRQRTNMKLVITSSCKPDSDASEKLRSYRLRSEIKIWNELPESDLAKVVAGAYAVVLPFFYDATGIKIIEAMKSEVPVLASDEGAFVEIAGDAALYFNPEDAASIAEQLKVIFKDEHLRSDLIKKGKLRAADYSWPKATGLMMQAIEQAVSN